eukprot:4061722-Karenia_brevis.AAC.1
MELQGVEEYRKLTEREGHQHHPRIKTFCAYISIKAKSLMGHLFRANMNDPMRNVISPTSAYGKLLLTPRTESSLQVQGW